MSQPHVLPLIGMLIVLIVALPITAALLRRRMLAAGAGPRTKLWRYARTILILWSLTALALYALRLRGMSADDVGLHAPHFFAQYFAGLIFIAFLALVGSGRRRRLDPQYERGVRAVLPSSAAEWSLFVPLAVSAGICEEFLYRGYALWVIAALSGDVWAGVAVSSLAFGLGHAYQGRAGIIGASISGVVYSAIFLYTGSLLPGMLAHGLQDLVGAAYLGSVLRRHAQAPEAA